MRGVTLIELLVALSISTVLIVALADTVRLTFNMSIQQPQAILAIDQARTVAAAFTDELRDATYGADGAYPLGEASSTEIIFYTPYHTGSTPTVERVRYFLASSTLYKGVTKQSGTPPMYAAADEQVTAQLAVVTSTPLFAYYDGTYVGTSSSPLAQPVKVTQVTYASMSLIVPRQDRRNATSTFTLTAGATIRNLKTNLGN
jgi:prepilin-type N-terminal cleavage/methylation domain-containing protein